MTASTKSFLTHLDSLGIIYELFERDRKSDLVSLRYRLDNGKAAEILVFLENDDVNVALRCYTGIKVTSENRLRALEFANMMTPAYRCTKLYIDEGEIAVGSDILLPEDNVGAYIAKHLDLFLYVVNETYEKTVRHLL